MTRNAYFTQGRSDYLNGREWAAPREAYAHQWYREGWEFAQSELVEAMG